MSGSTLRVVDNFLHVRDLRICLLCISPRRLPRSEFRRQFDTYSEPQLKTPSRGQTASQRTVDASDARHITGCVWQRFTGQAFIRCIDLRPASVPHAFDEPSGRWYAARRRHAPTNLAHARPSLSGVFFSAKQPSSLRFYTQGREGRPRRAADFSGRRNKRGGQGPAPTAAPIGLGQRDWIGPFIRRPWDRGLCETCAVSYLIWASLFRGGWLPPCRCAVGSGPFAVCQVSSPPLLAPRCLVAHASTDYPTTYQRRMTLFSIIALVVAAVIAYVAYASTKHRRKLPYPPGPPGLPLLGHLKFPEYPLWEACRKMSEEYGTSLIARPFRRCLTMMPRF